MADMELVIRISEKDYQLMKDGHIPFNILDKIMSGTPLPKGHGRLIDADVLRQQNYDTGFDIAVSVGHIDTMPTILKADKER